MNRWRYSLFSYFQNLFQTARRRPERTITATVLSIFAISVLSLFAKYYSFNVSNVLEAIPNSYLSSNLTSAYTAAGTLITALSNSGFSLGTSALVNTNTNSYMAWAWKEDPTSGFDIVTYTGNGANRTIAHSLTSAPKVMIIKRTDSTGNWAVFHGALTSSTTQGLYLNGTAIPFTDATLWNSTAPTASVFSLGASTTVNASGGSYIAYLWNEVEGYSKFGSYTGNGAADGAFVYTGFKPKYIMIKRTTTTVDDWHIFDTARSTYNPTATVLYANTTAKDTALAAGMDINSNGFKIRTTNAGINASGATYVYMAFAEYPFKEQFEPNGYTIASSTRFNGVNGNLTKTFVAGDQQKWTYSGWVKPGSLAARTVLMFTGTVNSTDTYLELIASDNNRLRYAQATNATTFLFQTCVDDALRDTSKWYHIVVAQDTTQATAADRIKMYIDGVLRTRTTGATCGGSGTGSTIQDPAQNAALRINSALSHKIATNGSTIDSDAYLTDINFIDGEALLPTSFGAFDSLGIWRPIAYAGSYIADSVKYLSSFLANGFTLFTNSLVNTLSDNYIAWAWKEDPTAGFDIVSYTGNGAIRTISHSLAATPTMMIVKRTDSTGDWVVYHKDILATNVLRLNATAISAASTTVWNSATPTPTVFTLGTAPSVNTNAASYLAYLFRDVEGYSKFGSYTGNGAADGAFVYTGFKPKYIMIKRTTTTVDDWHIFDTARSTYNPTATVLYANTTAIDTALAAGMDINSNGFKIRTTNAGINASGATYVYAAFAEYPFKEQSTPNGYTIASSTRFNGTNAFLNRVLTSNATDPKKYTYSFWAKRSDLTTLVSVFSCDNAVGSDAFQFTATDQFMSALGGSDLRTTGLYRDTSAWNHYLVIRDTTQAVASDREKIYVNGIQVTSFSTASYPALNDASSYCGISGRRVRVGNNAVAAGREYDGYLADFYFVDGQSLTTSDFGAFDSNGLWKPKAYSGTYGTNGFHLDFSNPSNPGLDTSGNGNNFTNNNIATTDNVIDTPTNNFATLNPLQNSGTLASGNLQYTTGGGTTSGHATHSFCSGKVYWEIVAGSTGAYTRYTGVADAKYSLDDATWSTTQRSYEQGGNKSDSGVATAYGASWTAGDVIGHAVDMSTGKMWFSKNGVWQASGDPATGVNPAFSTLSGTCWKPFAYSDTNRIMIFGQGGTSGLTYDSGAGGYFKYTPPTGFKALSTANLPAGTITKGSDYFDAKTYTGTGAALSLTSLNFQPDLLWIKDRTTANSHAIFSSLTSIVSGTYCYLASNLTSALTCAQSNSFHLDFASSTDPGNDVSGLGNDFTNNNIATTDNVIDTPTNNFAVLNPIEAPALTLTGGNLNTPALTSDTAYGTISLPSSGKYYWEVPVTSVTTAGHVGVMDFTYDSTAFTWTTQARSYYHLTGQKYNGATSAYGAAWASGDVIGVAVDMDSGSIWFSKNGTWQNSGDPALGTNAAFTDLAGKTWRPFVGATTAQFSINFGQLATSTTGAYTYSSSAGGYFKYTPPSGFKALSTANLAAGTITKGSNYFNAVGYTGTGAAQSISSLSFYPSLLWIKNRTTANNHVVFGDGSVAASTPATTFWFSY